MDPIIRTTAKQLCPVCGNSGELLHTGLRDQLFSATGEWSLRRCLNECCELLWLDPRPMEEDISRAYQTYYTHADTEQKSLIKSRLVAFVRDFCVNIVIRLCGQQSEREDIAHMYLRDIPPGRVLDIGCGDATFLARMKQRGWLAEGIDFDPVAASNAKSSFGIDVHIGRLDEIKFPPATFDAVTMNHVIEHVYDPVALLSEVRRILRPGGRLVVVTPNAMSMGHRIFGRYWRGLEPPRHIQIFTPPSLEDVAKSAELKVSKVFTTAVNAWFILSESFALKRGNQLKAVRTNKPMRSEQIHGLKMQLDEAFGLRSDADEGEEIVLIATKNGDLHL